MRDIEARLNSVFGVSVTIEKLALTMAQVRQYNPPPNPAKRSDPRSRDFIRRHGASSWEVDALPPDVLDRIIRDAFARVIDLPKMKAVIDAEEQEKALLRKAVKNLRRKKR